MKKIFILLSMVSAMVFAESCKDTALPVQFDVTINGDADGDVSVTFPDGVLALKGSAALDFHYGNIINTNDAVKYTVYELEDALVSNNTEAYALANEIETQLKATAASGTYFVRLKGKIREPVTGIEINFDKTFTNREN